MTDIRLDDVTMIYPFQKVSGILGRKRKKEILARQRPCPIPPMKEWLLCSTAPLP